MRAGSAKMLRPIAGWMLLLLSVAGVAYARPRVAALDRAVKVTSDVFALPSPTVLVSLSLGYRSALADLLYTSTVISYGIHSEEKRRFDFVGQYFDSIVALDPQFCQTYRYADLFLIYQAVGNPPPDNIRHARRLLEKGLEMCPSDGMLWLSAGQFMAFISPQFLTDPTEIEDFRAAGAKTLARAAEILDDGQNAQWQAMAAAGLLDRQGKLEAAVAFLERVYGVTDNPELKADIEHKLLGLRRDGELDRARRHSDAFNDVWRKDLTFLSRTSLLVVGPPYDVARCAGGGGLRGECADNWRDWFSEREPAQAVLSAH